MKKAFNGSNLFGTLPFKRLMKLEFSISGLKTREEAAFLQYNLLLNDSIIRCHVDFENAKCELLYNPLDINSKKAIALIKKPFKAVVLKEEEIHYVRLVQSGFHIDK